ncbi:hypothetical protein DKX38_026929 [Salix brachista]|uniref:Uncharacterized protein n=1 Tax=Salix brachista TaxID=2182728 RepID=A0A5N5JAX3_9ROSI|nr:hypothetical protein DKX38_026929 [Salix brachista]
MDAVFVLMLFSGISVRLSGIMILDCASNLIILIIVQNSNKPDRQAVKKVVTEVELRALEDILARVASQTTKEEQEYIAEENIQNQVQKDHIDLQRKFSLMEAIVKETKALQDLTRYPYKHYNEWNWLSGHD